MVRRIAVGTVAMAAAMLVAAGAAWAGGFSTVGLHSLPEGVEPGEPWEARFTVLAHGQSPVPGLDPMVRIERTDGNGQRTVAATETRRAGTYSASVSFPTAGRWRIEVAEHPDLNGHPFAGHPFGTVQIGDPQEAGAGAGGGGAPSWPIALVAALSAGLLAGGGAWLAQRAPATHSPPTTG